MNDKNKAWLKLLPLTVPFGVLFAAGAAVTVLQSLGFMVPGAQIGLSAWKELLTNLQIWQSLLYTLGVSVSAAAVSAALGTVLAWCIYRLPLKGQRLASVYKIPLILPHITVAYLVILAFSPGGFFSSLAARTGIINEMNQFPNILYGSHGIGIFAAYVFKQTSFVILMTMGVLRHLDERVILSARMLGASPVKIFLTIVLPQLIPIARSCFAILSLFALGSFDIPRLLGGSRPQMISITVYNLYFHNNLTKKAQAAALLTVLMILSLILIFLFLFNSRSITRSGMLLARKKDERPLYAQK